MKQLVYITGSGHSGSTLLDRLLGSHPDIAALGEIHRFSLGLHRDEQPFRCDCGRPIPECSFWSAVIDRLEADLGYGRQRLLSSFRTTDHHVLGRPSGDTYFDVKSPYQFIPRQPQKILLALAPAWLVPLGDRLGVFGELLEYARNSHRLYRAVSDVSGASTIVDSTKNPVRMRALSLTAPATMKVIYLRRDGRAVTFSRMKRQSVGMERAARIWVSENQKVQHVLRAFDPSRVLDVQYENLCAAPEEEMARIYQFLDLAYAPPDLSADRHAVGGNPSRFAGTTAIVTDEKWRLSLSRSDLEIFDRIAGSVN